MLLCARLLLAAMAVALTALSCRRTEGERAGHVPPKQWIWVAGDVHRAAGGAALLKAVRLGDAFGIVNLEGPIQAGPASAERNGSLVLRNAPEIIKLLKASGVHAVVTANNHQRDFGEAVVRKTRERLKAAGFAVADGDKPVRWVLGGLRMALLAFDLEADVPKELAAQLARLKNEVDITLVSFHTSGTPSYLAAPVLEKAVSAAAKARPQLIFAHGSHMLARVERRGDTVIAWGLGNLVFDCDCSQEPDGALLRVQFVGHRVRKAALLPIQVGRAGASARPATETQSTLQLLRSLRSSPLRVEDGWIYF